MSDKQTEKTIQLDTPIMRGKTEVTEIVLRKPQSGAVILKYNKFCCTFFRF